MALPRGEKALVYGAIITQGKYRKQAAGPPKDLKTLYARVKASKGL
jgi:hypothetical protein